MLAMEQFISLEENKSKIEWLARNELTELLEHRKEIRRWKVPKKKDEENFSSSK